MFKDISKIIFLSDMDGTLLCEDKSLPERNRSAIDVLRKNGGSFAVATGRVLMASRQYFKTLGLDCPVILCNGGMIYDCSREEIMWSLELPEKQARKMIAQLLEKFPEVSAEINTADVIYDVNINDIERYHWKIAGITARICDSLDDVPQGGWSKVLFAMPEETISAFAEYAASLEDANSVEFVTSSPIFHEMLPHNCSKGSAMAELLRLYGSEDCITVAMGDYYNDIAMLEKADFSACPSNAIDEVKAVCDMVCKADCGEGAVAEVIEYILSQSERAE